VYRSTNSGRLIKWVEQDKEAIIYMRTKTYNFMVWPRDSCLRVATKEYKGGYITVGRTPENEVEYCPLESGYVRGKILLSGFAVEPVGDSTGADEVVKVTYIFQVDAQGWLPTAVVELVNNYQPLSILGIRKLLTQTTDE